MSVRLNDPADLLAANIGTTLGTGDFAIGGWFKPETLPAGGGGQAEILTLAEDDVGDAAHAIEVFIWGDDEHVYLWDGGTYSIEGEADTGVALSSDTWYYGRLMRNGDAVTFAIYADDASTTPLGTATLTGFTGDDLTILDWVVLGKCLVGTSAMDGEVEGWRCVGGVTWTNAQTRAESQSYNYVLGTGTPQGNWRLKDADADADGTDDSSGAAHHFVNTGAVNGASTPAQLGGGGGGGGPAPVMLPSRNVSVFGGR